MRAPRNLTENILALLSSTVFDPKWFVLSNLVQELKARPQSDAQRIKLTQGSVQGALRELSISRSSELRKLFIAPLVIELGKFCRSPVGLGRYPSVAETRALVNAYTASLGAASLDQEFNVDAARENFVRNVIAQDPDWDRTVAARRGALKSSERMRHPESIVAAFVASLATPAEPSVNADTDPARAACVDFVRFLLRPFVKDKATIEMAPVYEIVDAYIASKDSH